MYFRDLDVEVEELESGVDSAQAATASLHKDWLDIKSVDVSVQKGLSSLFSSGRAQREKLEIEKTQKTREERKALEKYAKQGEPRKNDHHAYLMLVSRSEISSSSISAATEPSTIPQLHPGPSSGQTDVVHLGLD